MMNTVHDTDPDVKKALLKGVSIFSTLEDRELGVAARFSDFYSFARGDLIFEEGKRGGGLFIIREGEVLITKRQPDGETVNIAQFIRGECFGEMDLLENRAKTATAIADTDVVLLMFPAKGVRLEEIVVGHPDISARMLHRLMAVIAGRIRSTNRLLSEKSQWVMDLRHQLYCDKLTGLYNRTYLNEEFPHVIRDGGDETSLIMIKPDSFKQINDRFGHEAGDRALKYIAYSIMSQIRRSDIAVRYRGDEFAIILPQTGLEKALVFAGQLKMLMRALSFNHITGDGFSTTVSIGAAAYPYHARGAKELLDVCFNRMFMARDAGGDRIISGGPNQ